MANRKNEGSQEPATERETAPDTATAVYEAPSYIPPVQQAYVPPAPRQMRVERQGSDGSPITRRFPKIRGGVCEFCGVLDPNVPGEFQYRLCPHYRGMQAQCSYCPQSVNPDEVVRADYLNVAESPFSPGQLIMWCSRYECAKKHLERFQTASR